jgi:hypothetical protein
MNKIEKLTEFLNDQGKWFVDHQESEDNIKSYIDCFCLEDIYYDDIDYDVVNHVKAILNKLENHIIWDYCKLVYTYGYYRVNNEIESIGLGELEYDYSGIYNNETGSNCTYTDLIKNMSEEEIKEAKNNCDYYILDNSIFINCSYDRISLILDTDLLLEEQSLPGFGTPLVKTLELV